MTNLTANVTELNISSKELKDIMADYEWTLDYDNLELDDEQLELYTKFNKIPEADRIIICLYAHLQSQRKTAKLLGVSYSSLRKQINKIREKILE